LDDKYAEIDRYRAELSRLGQRRREAADELRQVDTEAESLIRRARQAGLEVTEIAERLGLSRQTVHKHLRKD
jgi:DNA-binding NarL/FixJ family response regulator